MLNGAVYGRQANSIVIYQAHFARLLAFPKPIRDQVIIELPCEIGLRTGEICMLLIENIDLEKGDMVVRDSKNYRLYPLALTFTLAKHIEQLVAYRVEGWLIRQEPRSGKVSDNLMKPQSIRVYWLRWARRAGIANWKEYTPRLGDITLLRHGLTLRRVT